MRPSSHFLGVLSLMFLSAMFLSLGVYYCTRLMILQPFREAITHQVADTAVETNPRLPWRKVVFAGAVQVAT